MDVRDIVRVLEDCESDPMWADHCEMRKSTVRRAIDEIYRLRQKLAESTHDLPSTAQKPDDETQTEALYSAAALRMDLSRS